MMMTAGAVRVAVIVRFVRGMAGMVVMRLRMLCMVRLSGMRVI
jgi:hypothetical protein